MLGLMTRATLKTASAALAVIALGSSLAACSSPASSTPSPDGAVTGPYTDGTYEASGEYTNPHGQETVDVTITLADDTITAVEVVGHGTDPNTEHYQGEFIKGIEAEVVGKKIDEISVDRVGGSSLTSGGFNAAVEEIKADAVA
jgi:uncharacterized protein with FMN-binding domain